MNTILAQSNWSLSNTYLDFGVNDNKKDPKFNVGDHVRLNMKIFLQKVTSEDVFMIQKNKNTVPWTYSISDLNGEEFVETKHFRKNNFKSQIQKSLE